MTFTASLSHDESTEPQTTPEKTPPFALPARGWVGQSDAVSPVPPTAKATDSQVHKLDTLLGAWQAVAAHEAHISGTPRGPIAGFKALDRELGGAFSPGVHIVHGQPGVGKRLSS